MQKTQIKISNLSSIPKQAAFNSLTAESVRLSDCRTGKKKMPITGADIQLKALEITKELNIPTIEFKVCVND